VPDPKSNQSIFPDASTHESKRFDSERENDREASKLSDTDQLCYQHVALAYARVLSLSLNGGSSASDHPRLILRLLHFAIHYHKHGMHALLEQALGMVPPIAWEGVAPQLFVQLQHSALQVRQFVARSLCALCEVAPAAVLYTLVAKAWPEGDKGDKGALIRSIISPSHSPTLN
jgi:hypothetical protein